MSEEPEVRRGVARTLLERFSRGIVLKRYLPKDLGSAPVLVSPDACLANWKWQVQSDLFDFAHEFVQPGNVVWDIGANVGLFSIAAAQRAGRLGEVVAVEADIWLADLLRKSAKMQTADSAPIRVLPVAVADSMGIAEFNIAQRGRCSNCLSVVGEHRLAGGARDTVSAITVTLDWLLDMGIAAPDVLKIDVEGAQDRVFSAVERVIVQSHPVILCEANSSQLVTDVLLRYGYTLFDWDTKPRVQTSRASMNTLAIPPAN